MIEVFGPLGPTKGGCLVDLVTHFLNDVTEPSQVLVFSAGDDVTDETMFAISQDHFQHERCRQKITDMVSIKVGMGKTSAKYRVQSPEELRQVLAALIRKFTVQHQLQQVESNQSQSPVVAAAAAVVAHDYDLGDSSKPTLDSLFFHAYEGVPAPNMQDVNSTSRQLSLG